MDFQVRRATRAPADDGRDEGLDDSTDLEVHRTWVGVDGLGSPSYVGWGRRTGSPSYGYWSHARSVARSCLMAARCWGTSFGSLWSRYSSCSEIGPVKSLSFSIWKERFVDASLVRAARWSVAVIRSPSKILDIDRLHQGANHVERRGPARASLDRRVSNVVGDANVFGSDPLQGQSEIPDSRATVVGTCVILIQPLDSEIVVHRCQFT